MSEVVGIGTVGGVVPVSQVLGIGTVGRVFL